MTDATHARLRPLADTSPSAIVAGFIVFSRRRALPHWTTGWVALVIMFFFGAYAFVWGTISTTVRQRLVPAELQGRVASVNMVGVFGGMVVGQALGGVIAQVWGLTAPWWFAFVGAALTLLLVWKPISQIVSAKPIADTGPEDAEPASQESNEPQESKEP